VVITEIGGRKQYIQFLQKGLVGVDAKTGAFLGAMKIGQRQPAIFRLPIAQIVISIALPLAEAPV